MVFGRATEKNIFFSRWHGQSHRKVTRVVANISHWKVIGVVDIISAAKVTGVIWPKAQSPNNLKSQRDQIL